MIYDAVLSRYTDARIARDKRVTAVLSTLIGDAQTKAKNAQVEKLDDGAMTALINSFIKNQNITLDALEKITEESDTVLRSRDFVRQDIALLQSFLPQQLSESELQSIVSMFVLGFLSAGEAMPQMGVVMNHLKTKYAGRYDGKLASAVVRTALA